MKKIYFLAIAFGAFALSSTAQVELTDNFDSYTQGDISPQASHWRTWSGMETALESADVSADQAFSSPFSMRVNEEGAPAGIDQLLLIDSSPNSGIYTVQWRMYVPAGREGYFNMQETITEPQTQALIGGNVFFNEDGTNEGMGSVDGEGATTFTFPHDTWFLVTCVYDLDNATWSMSIDETEVITDKTLVFNTQMGESLGGVDFYAPSAATLFYVDDVVLNDGLLGVDDFSADVFSVYPNPVKDVLNIESATAVDSIEVYDVLGKRVLTASPDRISPSIDMSALTSGAYMVKVTIGNASKTVKVIK